MAESWYCRTGEDEVGPVDSAQLQQLAWHGRLTAQSLVRSASSAKWVAAGRIRGLEFPASTATDSPPAGRSSTTLRRAKPLDEGSSPPGSIPVGIAVPPPVPSQVPVRWKLEQPPGAIPAAAIEAHREDAGSRNGAARGQLVWLLAGAGGVLLAVIAVGIWIALVNNRQAAGGPQSAANRGLTDELETAGGSPTPTDGPTGASQADNESARSGKSSDRGDLAAAIKSVGRWFDMSQSASISSRSMKLQVTGVWFDDEPLGDPASVTAETADAKKTARNVFVELRIANTQPDAPLNYNPWNPGETGDTKAAAMLATSDGRACPLVPLARAPHPSRQTRPVRIKPGQSLGELLVFEVPDDDDQALQLLLPTSAVAQGKRFLGLRIPRDMIAARRPMELADDGPSPRPSTAPQPVAGAAAGRDESIDDLKKSIVDSVKAARAEKEK